MAAAAQILLVALDLAILGTCWSTHKTLQRFAPTTLDLEYGQSKYMEHRSRSGALSTCVLLLLSRNLILIVFGVNGPLVQSRMWPEPNRSLSRILVFSLRYLHMNNNQLVQLPESFGHLTNLERLGRCLGNCERVKTTSSFFVGLGRLIGRLHYTNRMPRI